MPGTFLVCKTKFCQLMTRQPKFGPVSFEPESFPIRCFASIPALCNHDNSLHASGEGSDLALVELWIAPGDVGGGSLRRRDRGVQPGREIDNGLYACHLIANGPAPP